MWNIIFLSFIAAVTTAPIPNGLWRGSNGTISFTSDAPLEVISAQSNELSGIIDPSKNTFAFSLPAASFEGFNSALQQEHFHENYLESSTYPKATFVGKFIEDLKSLDAGQHEVRAKGILTIHGKSVERILKCIMDVSEKDIIITSSFTVPLADHKITIPQVVHQKIAEEIFVKVQITMKPAE